MAVIYSISSSYFGESNWSSASIWQGGVVPTASDQVFIRGYTSTFYQATYTDTSPWVGIKPSLKIRETGSLPPTGSIYTITDRELEIKIDYTGTYAINSENQFITSCSIDTSFNSWSLDIYPLTESFPSQKGGTFESRRFWYKPGKIIVDSTTAPWTASMISIENGGGLKINNTDIALSGTIIIRDGSSFEITGSSKVNIVRPYSGSGGTASLANMIVMEAAENQTFSMIGPEVRPTSSIILSAAVGDAYLTVADNSVFAPQDHIFVGAEDVYATRTDNGQVEQQWKQEPNSWDESFRVVAISQSDKILVARYTGLEAKITASDSNTVIYVDEERFAVGDKIIVNNQVRTIVSASIEDYLLRDYDFSGSGATLADWTTDVTRSQHVQNFTTQSGYGVIQHSSTGYRQIFVKDLFLNKFKIDAWISNMRQIDSGFTSTAGQLGVIYQKEPQSDYMWTTEFVNGAFYIDFDYNRIFMNTKGRGSYEDSYFNYTASFSPNGLKKMTVECSKGIYKYYINDIQVGERIDFSSVGSSPGRVGVSTFSNTGFTMPRFRVYAKLQKLTLDQATTFTLGDTIYETGVEYPHPAGQNVIKLASVITNSGSMGDNLMFSYRGQPEFSGDGIFPQIIGINVLTASIPPDGGRPDARGAMFTQNVASMYGENYNLGDGSNMSVILDLGAQRTFNNVGFYEQYYSVGQNMRYNAGGVHISGSNDAQTWTPITQSNDLRPRISPEYIRDYDLGTQTYRYVRIVTNGSGPNWNRFWHWVVRNLDTSSYEIQVNSTGGFEIGDDILVIPSKKYNTGYYDNVYNGLAFLNSGTGSQNWIGDISDSYRIISTGSNSIVLDRRINEGIITPGDLVVKVNRKLQFSGSYSTSSWATHRIGAYYGAQALRRFTVKNVSFQHQNGRYPQIGDGYRDGFSFNISRNFNTMSVVQGCTWYNCSNNYSPMYSYYGSGYVIRHNTISGVSNTPIPQQPQSRAPWLMTGNIFSNIAGWNGQWTPLVGSFTLVNHNYFSGFADVPGLYHSTTNAVFDRGLGPYSTTVYSERNRIFGTGTAMTMTFGYPQVSTGMNYKVRYNLVQNTRSSAITTYYQHTRRYKDPFFITSTNQRWDGGFVRTYGSSNWGGSMIGWSNIPQYGTVVHGNFNRYQVDYHFAGPFIWTNVTGSSLYNHYITGQNTPYPSYWYTPVRSLAFDLDNNATASFSVGFDYSMTGPYLREGTAAFVPFASQSIGVIAYKDGMPISPLTSIPLTRNLQNYTFTQTVSGSGEYSVVLLSRMSFQRTSFANFSSRITTADPTNVTMLNNTFDMASFAPGDVQQGRTTYLQGPQSSTFRLRGTRIR